MLAACGVQGPPRPPRVEQPAAVHDFAVIQRGRKFVFTFTVPTLATDGERLTKPVELEIFRTITPAGGKPPASPPAGQPWKILAEKDLAPPTQSASAAVPIALSDAELAQFKSSAWTFYLRALTRGFRRHPVLSDWSNPARRVLQNVSEPPEGIQVETTERALILRWPSPSKSIAAGASAAPSGYSVYKSLTGKPGTFELLGDSTSATFSDSHFQFDTPYYYFVRAVFKMTSEIAESDDSPVVEITPRDNFPLRPPTNLSAVFAGGVVDLIWTPNTETDLAGYNVERQEAGGGFVKLNSQLLPTPIFRDKTAKPGERYAYRVNAVDRAGNVSAPSEEINLEAR